MKAVNLLSRSAKQPGGSPAVRALASLTLALLAGIVVTAVVYVQAQNRAAHNDDQLTSLRQQVALAELDRERPQPAASRGVDAGSELRSAVIAALEGRANWSGLLRGVGRVIPPGAWLTKMSLGDSGASPEGSEASTPQPPAPTPTAPVAGQPPDGMALSLLGCALSQGLVGRVVSGLSQLPGATEVSVSSKQTGGEQDSSCGKHPSFQLSLSISRGAL